MKLRIVVSLPSDNEFQHQQAAVARSAAMRLGVDVELFHAEDDAITQSEQLLNVVQSSTKSRPDAIIVAPVSKTGLPRVARAATNAGIGWVVCNSNVDYLSELRRVSAVPVFAVSQDQSEIGLIQGRQLGALLPVGTVLYIQGPSTSFTAIQRRLGIESGKPHNVDLRTLRGGWSKESAYHAVKSWLRLATSRAEQFDLVAGQTHELALGARRAFDQLENSEERKRWLGLPFIATGISSQVEPLVDRGIFVAAVVTSTTTDVALEMVTRAILNEVKMPDCTFVGMSSYPSVAKLAANRPDEKVLG